MCGLTRQLVEFALFILVLPPAMGEPPKTPMDPCDRVKFILGGEEEDGAPSGTTPHQIFTELDELCMHHGEPVWKETARWVCRARVSFDSHLPHVYTSSYFTSLSHPHPSPLPQFIFTLPFLTPPPPGGSSLRKMSRKVETSGASPTWPPSPCTASLS